MQVASLLVEASGIEPASEGRPPPATTTRRNRRLSACIRGSTLTVLFRNPPTQAPLPHPRLDTSPCPLCALCALCGSIPFQNPRSSAFICG